MSLDHLSHLVADSERFRAVLQGAAPGTAVPTCPGWDVADLLWHLTEVQYFWGQVVRQRQTVLAEVEADLVRPAADRELLGLAERHGSALVEALRRTPPQTPVWTWADDQSVGFILRRQAHEALIHRVDAECAVGERTPMDAGLSADGVDEALRVMLGGAPAEAELRIEEAASLRLRSTDTGHSWAATLAQVTGTDEQGRHQATPTLVVAADDLGLPVAATVSGTAADLDCWLWNRPAVGPVELAGEVAVLAGLREVVTSGVQ